MLCQFLVLAGNAGTRSTLFSGGLFWDQAGKGLWCCVRTQCTIQLCGCVSFLVVAGKLILFEYLTVMIISQKYQELSL